jgi:hypothetical protein
MKVETDRICGNNCALKGYALIPHSAHETKHYSTNSVLAAHQEIQASLHKYRKMTKQDTVSVHESGYRNHTQYLVGNTRNLESTLGILETTAHILNDLIVC